MVSVSIDNDVQQQNTHNAPTSPITPDNPVSTLLDLFDIPSKHRRSHHGPRDDDTLPRVPPTLFPLSPVAVERCRPIDRPEHPRSHLGDSSSPPIMTSTTTTAATPTTTTADTRAACMVATTARVPGNSRSHRAPVPPGRPRYRPRLPRRGSRFDHALSNSSPRASRDGREPATCGCTTPAGVSWTHRFITRQGTR